MEKKQKVISQTAQDNSHPKAKKPIPPWSPLPQHINRVVQPAKPVMPRPKRTSAQIAAAEAEAAALRQRLEELNQQKKIALAEMELNEEEDAEEERTAIKHLRDLLPLSDIEEPLAQPMDEVLETFPMDEDEATQSEKDENINPEDGESDLEPDATKPVRLFIDLDLQLIRSKKPRSRRHR